MKKLSKTLLIIIGAIIFLIYACPLVAGILNLGNIFGMGVGIILILIGRFLDKLLKLHKAIISAFLVVVIVGTNLFSATMFSIIGATKVTEEKQSGTLIVLGCKVRGEQPSLQLYKRAMAGVEYLNNHPEANAILCGGQGSDEKISEAECIKQIMLENGIEESRLFLEDKSTSTDENIRFAKTIIEENNLDSNVVISTSDYHCYRAKLIAEKYGLIAESIPAFADRFSRPTFYTREVFGIWLLKLKNAF